MHLVKLFHSEQRGDTIVEVLIALAVLGSALGLSYATANRSLAGARQAQEHSEALQIAQGQLELLRSQATANPGLFTTGHPTYFCMDTAGLHNFSSNIHSASDLQDPANYDAACRGIGNGQFYNVSINDGINVDAQGNDDGTGNFTVSVIWDDVRTTGKDNVTLVYRLHQANATTNVANGGGITPSSAVLEDTGLAPQSVYGGTAPNTYLCYGSTPDANVAGGNGQSYIFCSSGTATGNVTAANPTSSITVYAREDQYNLPGDIEDAQMSVTAGGVTQVFPVTNTSGFSPYTITLGGPLAPNTYPVQIKLLNDNCCGPPGNYQDINLYIDKVLFNP
jgi:type II secretory pathway pseudopilin PulG